jgi:hypothetical protein
MNKKLSPEYEEFHNHVFGDTRYFIYNGLTEEVCTNLKGAERQKAEELVLRAINKKMDDERPIRAAGHFELQAAIPVLEKHLSDRSKKMNPGIRAAIIWTLLRIKNEKKRVPALIDMTIHGSRKIAGLVREDAIELLACFPGEPGVVDALCQAFLEESISVCTYAAYVLRKIFINDRSIRQLLDDHRYLSSRSKRESIVEQIRLRSKG